MVSTITKWLALHDMSGYSEIDFLSELTDQDLERLGIPLGHRRRMLTVQPVRASAKRNSYWLPLPAASAVTR